MFSREQLLTDLNKIPGLKPYLKFSTQNQTPIDDRLFAHIHLSREMEGLTQYHGNRAEVTTKYAAQILRNFIQHSNQQGIWFEHVKNAAADLETACKEREDFYRHRDTADQLIQYLEKRFNKKSRILLDLNWTSDYETLEGHGILVEFEKLNDNQYAIRVMNAGEGLAYHPPVYGKIDTSNTVSEHRYTKVAFREIIKKLQPTLSALNADNFYKALFALGSTLYSPTEASKTMVTGMCTWKMIIAFLKNRLHNYTAYLRIKQEIETQSLVDYLLFFINNPTAARAIHLELAMNNYARFFTEKVKNLDQESVQNGLQLCQYIDNVLKEKAWLKQTTTNLADWNTCNMASAAYFPGNTAADDVLNPTRAQYRFGLDTAPCLIGQDIIAISDNLSSIQALIKFIDIKIPTTQTESEKKSPALWKRYLDESVLHLPSIDSVYKKDQSDPKEKEKDLIQYAKKIKSLQEKYRANYAEIHEPYKEKVSPEYILCSAKLFLEILKTVHLYFGSNKVNLPESLRHSMTQYIAFLNSMQFYQMTQDMANMRKTCLDGLNTYANTYANNFKYQGYFDKKTYYALKKNALQQRLGISEDQLPEKGLAFLQRFTDNPAEPVSKKNPADPSKITAALMRVYQLREPRRIQNGQPLSNSKTLSTIENIQDLMLDNLKVFFHEFDADERFIDIIWDFFYTSGDIAYLDYQGRPVNIVRKYDYDDKTGIQTRMLHQLKPNIEKEAVVNYCLRHNQLAETCTDKDRKIKIVSAEKQIEENPCLSERLRETTAYDYEYQSCLSVETAGCIPISMDNFDVHANRKIPAQTVIVTRDVNHDICKRLNESKGGQFSRELENALSISTAIGIHETHIENILQYYEKNFSLLRKDIKDRGRLCLVLLQADSLKALTIKNPNIGKILDKFYAAYQENFNLQTSKEPGAVNFLHFLSVFCYHQMPDHLKSTLENQYQSSLLNPWGQLTDLYYRMQTDINTQEARCLVTYYSALQAYSKTPHTRTAPEERMLSQLQYQIVNLYHNFITKGADSLSNKKLLISEVQTWLRSIPKYQHFTVSNIGPEFVDYITSSPTFFLIEGVNQTIKLDLSTGFIEDGDPKEVDVPQYLKAIFPEQLKDVKHLNAQNGKYYLNQQGIEYCFSIEANIWRIYRKISNQWFEKINQTDIKNTNLLPNLMFESTTSECPKYDLWCKSVFKEATQILYAVDRQTKQPVYRSTRSLLPLKNNYKIMKYVSGTWIPLTFIQSTFESQYLIEAFENGKTVAFPRYDLTFKENLGKQLWTKNEQYALVHLNQTELGESFTQFLGLESQDDKKRKALIPCQSYIYDFDKKGVLLDTYGLVDAENTLNQITTGETLEDRGNSIFHKPNSAQYIECDVDEQGKLFAKKLSDKVYLVYLFLGQSNYTRALEVFQEIELAGYYSIDKILLSHFSKTLLENIPLKTRECDQKKEIYSKAVIKNGKRAAIQLKMLVNLLSISLCNQSEHAEKLLEMFNAEVLGNLLDEYNKDYSNTPVEMRLTANEKMTLLNFMTSKDMNAENHLKQGIINQENQLCEDRTHSTIPWHTGEIPHDATRFVASTLFKTEKLDVDKFSDDTANILKRLKTIGKTLSEDMLLDDNHGKVLHERSLLFNQSCVETAQSLPEHLENNIIPQFDNDIQKEKEALLKLVFKNQTTPGKETVGQIAKILGRKRSKTNFKTLIQLFIQNNPEAYRHQLGALTDEEIKEITVRTANLLLFLTSRQYYARLIPELEKAKQAGNNDKIGALLQEHRAYELTDPNARYFLAYEYLSGILIRDSQMQMLSPLLEKKEGSEEHKKYVFQLIMGGGKSKVLMPISSFIKANGDNLVAVVVPDSLFETNLSDLSRYSKVNFNQRAVPLRFKRADAKDPKKLENIRDRLKEVIINKDYVVTTKVTLQSIELSYLSILASNIDNKETALSVKLLEEILTIVQKQSDVFIDEIDSNLSCFDELNYTLNYLHYPPEYLVTLQVKFFDFLCKDTAGQKGSFYDQLVTPNVTLNKAVFNDLLSKIAQNMADDRDSILFAALKALDNPSKVAIIRYLSENSKDSKVPDAFHGCNASQKRIIGFCKAQFNNILPLILSKEENVHYGFSKQTTHTELVDQEIAIPYAGNNNPREHSRFASLFETFGYTTVAQLKKGVSKACLEQYLNAFIEQYESQQADTEKQQLAQSLFEALHLNPALYSIKLILEKDAEVFNKIWGAIKNNRSVILLILQKLILNKIKLYPFMLNSNSGDFTSMLNVVQGASGTIDNPGILDPDITFKKSLSIGTDGKTIAILRDKALPNVLNLDTKNATKYLEELSKQCNHFNEYQAIIDIGSHFTGVSNQVVANGIADFYKAHPNQYQYVLYFNQDNILCALPINGGDARTPIELGSSDAGVIKSKIGCNPNQYFVYFDQIHTVGTDIPLAKAPVGAKAFVSFSPTTTQQALLQGVMRARDLAASQNVAFVGNTALRHYLDTRGLAHDKESILMVARENLLEQIHEGAFRAATQKIKAIYRRALLNTIRNANTLQEKQELLRRSEGLVFSKMELDPSKLFVGDHTIENTQLILEKMATQYEIKFQHTCDATMLGKIKKDVDLVIQHCARYCRDKTVYDSYPNAQAEVELQAEAELQQEAEAEKRNELELARLDSYINYTPRIFKDLPNLSTLGDQLYSRSGVDCLSMTTELDRLSVDCQDYGIERNSMYASPNLLVSNENNRILSQPAVKTCYHVLWIESKAEHQRKVILLSDQDAEFYRASLNKLSFPSSTKYHFALKTMSGESACDHSDIHDDDDWQKRMHQVRFLIGQLNEDNTWLWEDPTKRKLEFYRKFILPCHPTTENTLLFLEGKLKKQQKTQQLLEESPNEKEITPPWVSAKVSSDFRTNFGYQNHKKYFLKSTVTPPKDSARKGYVPKTYHEVSIRSAMHLWLMAPVVGFFIGCFAALILVIKACYLKFKIKKKKLMIEHITYQQVERIQQTYNWFIFGILTGSLAGAAVYRRAILFYKNTKAQYEQAEANALRKEEISNAGSSYQPVSLDQLLEATETQVPLVWGEPALVNSRNTSREPSPTNEHPESDMHECTAPILTH